MHRDLSALALGLLLAGVGVAAYAHLVLGVLQLAGLKFDCQGRLLGEVLEE